MSEGFDAGRLISEVDAGAERLEKAADALTDAIRNFEETEQAYEYALAVERTKVFHDKDYDRPPGADVRHDLALQRLDPQLRADYAAARAQKEALMVRYRALAAAVSARQSVLKAIS